MFYCSREIIRKFLGKKPASAASGPTDIIAGVPMAKAMAVVRAIELCCHCLWCFRVFSPPFFFFCHLFFFFFPFFPSYYHPGSARVLAFKCLQNIQCSNACHRYSDHPWSQHCVGAMWVFLLGFYMLENGMQITSESLIFLITWIK